MTKAFQDGAYIENMNIFRVTATLDEGKQEMYIVAEFMSEAIAIWEEYGKASDQVLVEKVTDKVYTQPR